MSRDTFDKDYLPNWTEDYYRVAKMENTRPPVYKLSDTPDEVVIGMFYSQELQKILVGPNASYRIENIFWKMVVFL